MITILLRGAPEGMRPVLELDTQQLPDRICLPFYGCNQHFDRVDDTADVEGQPVPVFVWAYRTAIAE
ncbi:DUF5988 family protein [Streptomyces sp. NPDC006863]|uniref:DUF5988 family protein n=1 Tax=unclassified Streptomyces TaxID=2593676 RepID=UPI0033DD146B